MRTEGRKICSDLVVVFFAILFATQPVGNFIRVYTGLFYYFYICLVSFGFFFFLFRVLSSLLRKAQKPERLVFFVTFAVISVFFSVALAVSPIAYIPPPTASFVGNFFGEFGNFLSLPLYIVFSIIPLEFVFDLSGSFGMWTSAIFATFLVIILFALVSFAFAVLARKGNLWPQRVLRIFVVGFFIVATLFSLDHAYVFQLTVREKCISSMHFYQCFNYKHIGGDYFSYNDQIYYLGLGWLLVGEKPDNFSVFDYDDRYAFGNETYYKGRMLDENEKRELLLW